MFCEKCGSQLGCEERFCDICSEGFDKSANQSNSNPECRRAFVLTASFKPLCRIAILICVLLWVVAPFMTVSSETMGYQSSGFVMVFYSLLTCFYDIDKIGTVAATPAFWAALISFIGIVVCFFTLGKKNMVTRITVLITDTSLAAIFVFIFFQIGENVSSVMDVVGIGYIGIFAFLFLVYLIAP